MDLNEYEKYCKNNACGNFMQSVNWAKIKESWTPEYVTARDESGNINGCTLVLVKKIPFFNTAFLYAPRGFVCDMHDKRTVNNIFEQIKLIAEKHGAYALKTDPLIDERDFVAIKNLTDLGFVYHGEKTGYDNIQCKENYILDIKGKTCDELFASFKPKWRYNIRLAKRKGVRCEFFGEEKLDDFCALMQETGRRDGFEIRSKEYFQSFLRAFDGAAKLCMCYIGETPLSGALFVNYAGTTSYVYGCSSDKNRQYMPNYLMQWSMIRYAAECGCHTYDFCGVPYWYDESHKNYGVYRFKQGFNGKVKTYAGEFDFTFRNTVEHFANLAMKLRKRM